MENLYTNKNQCCGCTACRNICPKNAITMAEDGCGFFYPQINQSLCVDCGLCKSVCAFQNGINITQKSDYPLFYAVKNKDEAIRKTSSSGGVFATLSEYVLKNDGVVYGAAFNNAMNVVHMRADNIADCKKFRSSKYVQSRLLNTFRSVRNDLENGLTVLFSGTGCQIVGLKAFLKKDYEKLFLADIICHGVPSPKIFNDYKKFAEGKANSKINYINFRAKKIYGETQDINVKFENGKSYCEFPDVDYFKQLFSKNLILRPSCFECKYTNTTRCSDITLGDFWGISKSLPNFDDKKGVSLVIINSQKGKKIMDEISKAFSRLLSFITNAFEISSIIFLPL